MSAPIETEKPSWFTLKYEQHRETVSETRNVLLIVVALIIAVTFQAGVNPPGGVWQDESYGHKAGTAIYADREHAFYLFLISNTLALSTSVLVLICLTNRFPYYLELWIAITAMFVSYGSAVLAIAPEETVRFRYVLGAGFLPFGVRVLIQLFYKISSSKD